MRVTKLQSGKCDECSGSWSLCVRWLRLWSCEATDGDWSRIHRTWL